MPGRPWPTLVTDQEDLLGGMLSHFGFIFKQFTRSFGVRFKRPSERTPLYKSRGPFGYHVEPCLTILKKSGVRSVFVLRGRQNEHICTDREARLGTMLGNVGFILNQFKRSFGVRIEGPSKRTPLSDL
jgi:hypothetical protein